MGGYRDLMSRDDVAAYILQRIAEEETQARRRLRPGWRWGKASGGIHAGRAVGGPAHAEPAQRRERPERVSRPDGAR